LFNRKININSHTYNVHYEDGASLDALISFIELQNKISPTENSKMSNVSNPTSGLQHYGYEIRHTRYVTLIRAPLSDPALYFKTFHYFGIKRLRPIIFYPSKSFIFFNSSNYLLKKGINVPKIIAYGEVRRGIFLEMCFILYKELQGTSIYNLLNDGIDDISKGKLFKKVAGELHKLHNQGIYHGDLRPTNILWDKERVSFVDLDKTKIRAKNNIDLTVKDLVKLNTPKLPLSILARMRFFIMYLRENSELWENRKAILKKIIKGSLKKHNWNKE